jgi:hypothetical protein
VVLASHPRLPATMGSLTMEILGQRIEFRLTWAKNEILSLK